MKRYAIRLSMLAATLVAFAAPSARADLVGYWTFDDTVDDATPYANNGSVGAGTTSYDSSVPSAIGSGKSFDFGPGSTITVADSSSLRFDQALTLSFWIKGAAAELKGNMIGKLWKTTAPTFTGWQIQDAGGTGTRVRPAVLGDGGGINFGANEINAASAGDDVWHHIAYVFTISGTNVNIDTFRDGSFLGSDAGGTTAADLGLNNTNPLIIGQSAFTGNLDDLALWNEALNATQIGQLFAGALSPSDFLASAPSAVPAPAALPAGLALIGMTLGRRRRRVN